MNEQELLLQRFIDQDLSPAERLEFLEALDRDPAIRQQLLETERLVLEATALPRRAPASAFADRVVANLPPSQHGLWARAREFFLAPHVVEVNWTFAKAAAAACALMAVTWLTISVLPKGTRGGPALQTVASAQTVYMRVALLNPQAESVTIAGDFNGWDPQSLPLRRADNGLWTITIPLKPGRYEYMYQVDGKWVTDPLASEFSPDGFGDVNAVLNVQDM
jgi:Glycogen recognition site of AMP-activated protein kinase